jgi:uncharacterized membrane protein YdjX (TVP38/TMEM64 family)
MPLPGVLRNRDWLWVVIATINPVVPSSALGYAFGLSPIPFRRYFWSTLLAMLPLQIAFVTFGGLARGLWSADQSKLILLSIIAVASTAAVVVVKHLARLKSSSQEGPNE